MANNTDDDFIIPERFIEQLKEFSNGGFVLLTFSKKGRTVVHTFAESEKDELAIQGALEKYMNKLEAQQFEREEDEEDGK